MLGLPRAGPSQTRLPVNPAAVAAAATPQVDPSQLQECGDMARDTLTPPPGATKAVVFDARGSENYTCM